MAVCYFYESFQLHLEEMSDVFQQANKNFIPYLGSRQDNGNLRGLDYTISGNQC